MVGSKHGWVAGIAMFLGAEVALGQPVSGGCEESPDALSSWLDSVESIASIDANGVPTCASPLFRAIATAARPLFDRGTLDGSLAITGANVANPRVLVTGPEIFAAMARVIEGAEQEVLLQTYLWEDSEGADTILAGVKALEERRRREAPEGAEPVVVRVLSSAFDIEEPKPSNFTMVMPRIARQFEALALDERYVRVEIAYYPHLAQGALHSKTMVVDGRHAVVSGANPQRHHDSGHPWFDAAFEMEGDVGASLRAEFATAWKKGGLWRCGGGMPWGNSSCVRRTKPLPVLEASSAAAVAACRPMLVAGRRSDGVPFRNRIDNPGNHAILAALGNAQRVVRMQTPNLNDDAAKRALVDAAARGVRVEIVLAKNFNDRVERLPGQGGDNATNVDELYRMLAARGVADPCAVLGVRWFSEDGVTPVSGNGPGASHAKYLSIDDQVVIVGSQNMDTQSWNHSREVNVIIDDAETTRAWDASVAGVSFARGIPAGPCARQ